MPALSVYPLVKRSRCLMKFLRDDAPRVMQTLDESPNVFGLAHSVVVTANTGSWQQGGRLRAYTIVQDGKRITPTQGVRASDPLADALLELNERGSCDSYASAIRALLPYCPATASSKVALERIEMITTRHGIALLDHSLDRAMASPLWATERGMSGSAHQEALKDPTRPHLGRCTLSWIIEPDAPDDSAHARLERETWLRQATELILRRRGTLASRHFALHPDWTLHPERGASK